VQIGDALCVEMTEEIGRPGARENHSRSSGHHHSPVHDA
jgi:hypothetical protein